MSKRKTGGTISGKGYYIALILCAIAIGISGYLYYRNENKAEQQLQKQQMQKDEASKQDKDVEAVATQPGDTPGKQDETQTPEGQETQQPAKKPAKTSPPVTGEAVAQYSMDALCYNQTTRDWRVHNGVDYAAEAGTKVCAAADGKVTKVYEDETMGATVVIDHGSGYSTTYSSLDAQVSVAVGDAVTMGQSIGKVGQTALLENAMGDHVHFSVSCNGQIVDPGQFLPN